MGTARRPGPRPLHAARSLRRWWWPILTAAGFLAVVAQVLGHDDPTPGLSAPGLVTIALAAAVVALLTIHRRYGPGWLARAVAEYTVVALLATLLATPGVGLDQPADSDQPTKAGQAKAKPQAEAAAGDDQPAVIRAGAKVVGAVTRAASALTNAVRWLVDLWRRADQQATAKGEAMAAPAPLPVPACPLDLEVAMFVDQRPNGFDLLMLILALLGPVIALVLVLLGGR